MLQISSSRKYLVALALFAGTSLVAGCGSDEKVTKTTTTEQSSTTAPMLAPTNSTTTTTTTTKESQP